jgi:GH15 family glucan-1,4-alpha-glucosidase
VVVPDSREDHLEQLERARLERGDRAGQVELPDARGALACQLDGSALPGLEATQPVPTCQRIVAAQVLDVEHGEARLEDLLHLEERRRIGVREDVLGDPAAEPLLTIAPDRVNQAAAMRREGPVDHVPELRVVLLAHVLEHAHGHERVAGSTDVPVVVLHELHPTREPLLLRCLPGVLHLFTGDVERTHGDAVVAGHVERQRTPATASLDHVFPGAQIELGADVFELGDLRLLQGRLGSREVGARVDHAFVEEQLVELVPDVVVMAGVVRGCFAVLPQSALEEAPGHETPDPGRRLAHPEQLGQHPHQIALDGDAAVDPEVPQLKIGVEQDPPERVGVAEDDSPDRLELRLEDPPVPEADAHRRPPHLVEEARQEPLALPVDRTPEVHGVIEPRPDAEINPSRAPYPAGTVRRLPSRWVETAPGGALSRLDLAVVGNGSFSALVDPQGRVCWACMPQLDGDPVFSSLLDGGQPPAEAGFWEVEVDQLADAHQHYDGNTAILVTTLRDVSGGAVEITDFAPRFPKSGRMYRPLMLIRRIRPITGEPRVRMRLRPTHTYGRERPATTRGSNHVRYVMPDLTIRLTTDIPITYALDETPFVLERDVTAVLGPDESFSGSIEHTAREWFERTQDYWIDWSRTLSIPFEWQEAVVRAAITLKLCASDETGAIVAAMTTSIPEAPDSGRNWDYRYCWLRDSYFTVHALNRLGATKTMEHFLGYLTDVIAGSEDGHLQPLYGIGQEARIVEREEPALRGYCGMGPVRVGNQAWEHVQNDVYGSVVLASTQVFFDRRLVHPGGIRLFERLEKVGEQAIKLFDQPDAGLWELRTRARVHTYSSVMCWAACDRLARIASHIGQAERARHWRAQADHIHAVICERAWNEELDTFVESFGGSDLDASLLLLEWLGFLKADDPRFASTVAAVERELRRGDYLYRYHADDDFGAPQVSFNVCTFWYIDALAALGRKKEARQLFENMLRQRNHVGLLSEDLDPETGELWGNFPQTYSMVGLILCAMRLSKSWHEAF